MPPIVWPVLLMAALSLVSSIPGAAPGQEVEGAAAFFAWLPPRLQNLLHVPVYGVLAWAWFRALAPRFSPPLTLAAGFGLTLAFALLDEWHQAHVPGRYPSATDLAADALGAALAAALYAARGALAHR